jgi:PRTRC genetic system ThiF family protein
VALKTTTRKPRASAGAARQSARCAVRAAKASASPEIDLTKSLAVRPLVLGPAPSIHLCLIGLGGTGSWLAPHVVRLAWDLKLKGVEPTVTFVDPDIVEASNVGRQNFCPAEVGRFKAETLAMRYAAGWDVEIHFHTQPFREEMARLGQSTRTVLIGCVDNAAARQAIARAVSRPTGWYPDSTGPMQVWWLDLGNSRDSGQALLGSTTRPEGLRHPCPLPDRSGALPAPSLQHPELLNPRPEELEGDVSGLSCEEMAARNVQSLAVNTFAAAVGTVYLSRLINSLTTEDSLKTFATYFDLDSLSMQSHSITEDAVRAFGRKPRRRQTRPTALAAPAH